MLHILLCTSRSRPAALCRRCLQPSFPADAPPAEMFNPCSIPALPPPARCPNRPGLDFFFPRFFLVKYSKSLEEGSFRNRAADFLWMLLFGSVILVSCFPVFACLGGGLLFSVVGRAADTSAGLRAACGGCL